MRNQSHLRFSWMYFLRICGGSVLIQRLDWKSILKLSSQSRHVKVSDMTGIGFDVFSPKSHSNRFVFFFS